MRPSRLQLEGFTSFREPTEVDFDGADVFALTGPTGSGKSSIVDAMGFALYGRIHRYGEKLVHAAISQGRNEARVRFDFTAGGANYTAVRVVRRTGPGRATTKEARLECDGEVLAGDEKGLTTAVTALLGLDFEQYCRCVVLPQGAFAEFLHDTPKGRQDLLTSLLDLRHYRVMGQEAGQRAAAAGNRADLLEERLSGDLAGATSEALERAADRVHRLDAVADKVTAVAPELEALGQRARDAAAEAARAADQGQLLAAVEAPAGIDELAASIVARRADVERAAAEVRAAEQLVQQADASLAALGDRRRADAAVAAFARLRQLDDRRKKAEPQQASAEAELERTQKVAGAAATELNEAQAALEVVRNDNRAHALLATLHAGDRCPVCAQVVDAVPPGHEPADFASAQSRVRAAEDASRAATAAEQQAREALAKAATVVAELDRQVDEARAATTEFADEVAAMAVVEAVEAAERAVADARRAETQARRGAGEAAKQLEQVQAAEANARRAFEVARDAVAPLGPPSPARTDLRADWDELVGWAATQTAVVQRQASVAGEAAAEAGRKHRALADEIARWCAEVGVEVGRAAGEALAAARGQAEAEHRRVADAIAEAERVRAEVARLRADEHVAHTLAVHLRADRFEKWLLDEAVAELTEGATALLQDLSAGAYSLALDPKSRDFAVVDHRNADEVRPVRTLSGGETFLASLSLALALADRVADLASAGSVRLDALFLDEGFGTLDADTLDVVAAAIENLGASGRMVGIVTHVRELAERVPVRFEVSKGPTTSNVEKVLL